jgi:hypothetical protein
MRIVLDQWLVRGWQHSWTWFSVHMHVIGIAILALAVAVPTLPDTVQALVPLKWRVLILGIWGLLGLLARLMKQGS